MYVPRHFAADDPAAAAALLRAAAFGHLVVADGDGFEATPLPILVDDAATTVRGHVARANPIWRFAPCAAMLAVTASNAYISPSWYPSKADHGKVVPTWNYEVVHVHGNLVTHDDDWTLQLVRDLTDHHEADMPQPWSVDDAPDDYIVGMLRAIVGVSIEVTHVQAKRKLSQNRPPADIDGAIHGLRSRETSRRVADAMGRQRTGT